jgi:hypothetical protein
LADCCPSAGRHARQITRVARRREDFQGVHIVLLSPAAAGGTNESLGLIRRLGPVTSVQLAGREFRRFKR